MEKYVLTVDFVIESDLTLEEIQDQFVDDNRGLEELLPDYDAITYDIIDVADYNEHDWEDID